MSRNACWAMVEQEHLTTLVQCPNPPTHKLIWGREGSMFYFTSYACAEHKDMTLAEKSPYKVVPLEQA